MNKKITLIIDGIINLILAILLLSFSKQLSDYFGVPSSESNFYPNILGAAFLGITIALFIEAFRKKSNDYTIGLGLIGAICINLSGGIVLLLWLIFGELNLPVKGQIFLWTLDLILLLISLFEIYNILKKKS